MFPTQLQDYLPGPHVDGTQGPAGACWEGYASYSTLLAQEDGGGIVGMHYMHTMHALSVVPARLWMTSVHAALLCPADAALQAAM